MMMLRTLIFAAGLLAFAGSARADDAVNFSAGEHGHYSRLVVAGDMGDLRVRQSGRDVEVHFSNHIDIFNFSDINERRKAHRVLNARAAPTEAGSRVELQLNCECVVAATKLEDNKWILDIHDEDGDAIDAVRQAAKLTETPPSAAQTRSSREDQPTDPAVGPGSSEDLSVEQAHRRMMDLLQQAAKEGLVTIKSETSERPASDRQSPDATRKAASLGAEQGDDKSARGEKDTTHPPGPCLADGAFFIDGARFEKDPLVEISALESQLIQGSVAQQKAIVDKLAQGYLAIGFGQEAFALLADHEKDDTLLADMSRVVAETKVPESGVLLNAVNCRGAHAFWQAAASEPAAAVARLKRSDNAVETLPTRLRALLATRIARKMIDAGDWENANQLYEVALAASEIPSASLQYVAARLREHEGAIDESQQMLLDLAAGDSEASKEALLTLAEQYADGEGRPHDGFVEDIGALAKLERGSKAGAEAAFVEADIWAETGNIEASLLLLNEAAEADPEIAGAARARARSVLNLSLSSTIEQDRIDALGAYLEYREFLAAPEDDGGFHRKIARTALDLGLPNVAYDALQARARPGDKAAAKLKTRAALQSYEAEAALAAAAPYTDESEFAVMVVRANMQDANYYSALAAASALPASDRKAVLTALSAWRAGDWASAAKAFAAVDPKILSEKLALQYAMSAYMTGASSMPAAAEAVLRNEKSSVLEGARSLFADAPDGPIISRAELLAASADEEIELIEEALGRG